MILQALESVLIRFLPALAKALGDYLLERANRIEQRAAVIQAKAASAIEGDAERATAMRAASKRLTDATNRD